MIKKKEKKLLHPFLNAKLNEWLCEWVKNKQLPSWKNSGWACERARGEKANISLDKELQSVKSYAY